MIQIEHNGATVGLFASKAPPGFIDFTLREEIGGDWEAVLAGASFVTTDEEGQTVPVEGVHLDLIGPIVITPAVLSEDGLTVLTSAEMDERTHINLRIRGDVDWQSFALDWAQDGTAAPANAGEQGVTLNGLTMIDPDSLSSPSRVWA